MHSLAVGGSSGGSVGYREPVCTVLCVMRFACDMQSADDIRLSSPQVILIQLDSTCLVLKNKRSCLF